nr:MAG TPA: hypothetical protein [Caudoviricetes sp.]
MVSSWTGLVSSLVKRAPDFIPVGFLSYWFGGVNIDPPKTS